MSAPFAQLSNIVRGVYFHNEGLLTGTQSVSSDRICLLSEGMLRRSASATRIQRHWKGYIFRKKHLQSLQQLWNLNRAAIIVQRWARRLPRLTRESFMEQARATLEGIPDNRIYMPLPHYMGFLDEDSPIRGIRFAEQNSRIYKRGDELVITWDDALESA